MRDESKIHFSFLEQPELIFNLLCIFIKMLPACCLHFCSYICLFVSLSVYPLSLFIVPYLRSPRVCLSKSVCLSLSLSLNLTILCIFFVYLHNIAFLLVCLSVHLLYSSASFNSLSFFPYLPKSFSLSLSFFSTSHLHNEASATTFSG